ncbi:ferritin-like domain-containing protein [Pedobacter arcticus]|uniref:ferritin-like domain-containing protein n=1 Tax=Pedobacter arcticus TaxID=752140 RepID=UPI000312F228|nr:ferritin-like domain-containing protein [Pedobacter arcticus]
MNFLNILKDIEAIDPEITDKISPRRDVIKNITSFGSKVALSALPFAMGSMFNKASAQTSSSVGDVLNFALTLEYLEAEFYTTALNSPALLALIPAGPALAALQRIRDDENAHVKFLKDTLAALKVTAVSKPTFDFTAKGTFPTVFSNYGTFLAVSQAFEDTGVRAYKGQAPNLIGNKVVLTAALSIHSVEARHASHIRQMRRATGGDLVNLKPWITGDANNFNDSGVSAVNATYMGENNKMQATVDITTLTGATPGSKISYSAAVEAFDEPLTTQAVLDIANLFIVK